MMTFIIGAIYSSFVSPSSARPQFLYSSGQKNHQIENNQMDKKNCRTLLSILIVKNGNLTNSSDNTYTTSCRS